MFLTSLDVLMIATKEGTAWAVLVRIMVLSFVLDSSLRNDTMDARSAIKFL
jgi:hypothetical protein